MVFLDSCQNKISIFLVRTASFQCAHNVKVVDGDEFNVATTCLQNLRHVEFSLRLCLEASVISSLPSVSCVKTDVSIDSLCRRNEWSDRARELCIN